MAAIRLLQELEFEGLQASPEQQEILSRYVGWGGLADAFDENKPNWSDEFAELYATLSPEEYAAARASTLNAHYTSPTVIKAIYEAVGNMGFQSGNILEPSMGVGNFFGLLPEQMQGSKLYGVELDSITGRIAKQLYFRIRSIRFIAVNENFDTANPEDAHSGIIIPLRNMINEAYALDIGRKIRAQQRQAMKDGKFIGARTPYGYLKAEDDCHQLIIDPVAAVVVQRMFRWASEGAGLNTIAVRLNEAGVLTPSHYKKMQGKITHENLLGSGKWQTRTVGVILRSEVYTGDLVQGQTKTVDHRQVKADAEEWTVVRDTHEAIISREQFAAVQEILNQTASRAKAREVKAYTPNLLKGKVFCAHCGGSLHRQRNIRKKSDDVYFYHCLSQSRISKDACPGVTIREDMLLDMLADMLQDALDTALGQYTLSLAELPRQAADRAELREKITSRKQEIQRLRGIVRSLYENLVQGVLTKDEYFDYKEKYESRIADLAVEMEQLDDGLRTMDTQIEQHRALEQDAAQIKTDRGLTGALIERLIDRIEVSHDKQITVRYRFQSEFETYAEVLEQCRNM